MSVLDEEGEPHQSYLCWTDNHVGVGWRRRGLTIMLVLDGGVQ